MIDYSIDKILIILAVGFASGFVNVIAGGGSALTMPALIFMGMPAPLANGTNRLGILFQSISASITFRNNEGSYIRKGLKMTSLTLPGAIIGSIFAVDINTRLFEQILGVVMIGIILTMVIPQKKREINEVLDEKLDFKTIVFMLITGFYGGFIQVGIGYILMAIFYHYHKLSLLRTNMLKVLAVSVYIIPSFLIFAITDNVDYYIGMLLALSSGLGSWLSAKFSMKVDEKILRYSLLVAIGVMALKLLGLY